MSSVVAGPDIASELAGIAGGQHVIHDAGQLAAYAIDEIAPAAVVMPGSAEEVAAVLRLANERGWSVVPAGGMTQQAAGAKLERVDVVLWTKRLSQVLHYDPADLTVGFGAGTTLAEADALLAEHGQMLPLDPALPQQATIGGVLATAGQGPLKHGYGGARDYCIGMRFVSGDGVVGKGGGRVVKNVAG